MVYNNKKTMEVCHTLVPDNISDLYYTAKEARTVLGLNENTFQTWVKTGKIPRIMLPGRRQGVYAKRDIDVLASVINAAVEPPARFEFSKSTPGDQVEEMEVGIRCFDKELITPVLERIGFQLKSEHTFYSLKEVSTRRVVGYISMFYFPPEFLDDILTGKKVEHDITVDEVLRFPMRKPFDIYIDVLAVDPGLPWRERRMCTKRIVQEFANLLLQLLDNGYDIRTVYTVSATKDGDNLIRNHFRLMEGKSLKPGRNAYEFSVDEQGIKHLRELTGRFS